MLAESVGAEIDWAPITDEGVLDMDAFASMLERGPKLVASPTSRTCSAPRNPLAEISRLAHDAGALVLADGAQAAPKMPVDVGELGVDFYALHRAQGLRPDRDRRAVGAARAAARDAAVPRRRLDDQQGDQGGHDLRRSTGALRGGHASRSPRRSGCAAAIRWLDALGMDAVLAHEREIADFALERLAEVPGLRMFGPPRAPDRVGPVSFELEGVHAHDVAEILDRHGVAVRAGHHCAQPLMDRLGVAATARA